MAFCECMKQRVVTACTWVVTGHIDQLYEQKSACTTICASPAASQTILRNCDYGVHLLRFDYRTWHVQHMHIPAADGDVNVKMPTIILASH